MRTYARFAIALVLFGHRRIIKKLEFNYQKKFHIYILKGSELGVITMD